MTPPAPRVLLDAFALLAYLREEPAAADVQQMLWEGASMSAINVAEVVDRLVRVFGVDPDEAEIIPSALSIEIVDVDAPVALAAGLLRARHYRPTGRTLSMADSIAAATALLRARPLATADPVLLDVMTAEEGSVVALQPSG